MASCFNLSLLFVKLRCALNPTVPRACIRCELLHQLQHKAVINFTSLQGNIIFCAQPWLRKSLNRVPGQIQTDKGLPCSSKKTQGSSLPPAPNQLLLRNSRGEIETTPRIAFASNKTGLLEGRIVNKNSVLMFLGQRKKQNN